MIPLTDVKISTKNTRYIYSICTHPGTHKYKYMIASNGYI